MRLAYAKMRGNAHWGGTHVLRHTAATRMLQHGASLKEIADVLGHRSIQTTTIYTKVDLRNLTAVATPWPEVHP
jgi:site-specific recombinase XerD